MTRDDSTDRVDGSGTHGSLSGGGAHEREIVGPARIAQLAERDHRAVQPFLRGTEQPKTVATTVDALAGSVPAEGPVDALDEVVAAVRCHEHPLVNEAATRYFHAASRAAPAAVADHAAVFETMLSIGFSADGPDPIGLGDWREVQRVTAALSALVDDHPDAVVPAAGQLTAFVADHLGQASLRLQVFETLTDAMVPDALFGDAELGESPDYSAVEPTGRAHHLASHVGDIARVIDRRNGRRGEWALLYAVALERPGAVTPHLDTVVDGWRRTSPESRRGLFVSGVLSLVADARPRPLRTHADSVVAAAAGTLATAAEDLSAADHPIEYPHDRDVFGTLWCLPVVLSVVTDLARACPRATVAAFERSPLRRRVRALGPELWATVPELVEAAADAPPAGSAVLLELLGAIAEASGVFVRHHADAVREIRAAAGDERVRAATDRLLVVAGVE
jgi:hypothetical protein